MTQEQRSPELEAALEDAFIAVDDYLRGVAAKFKGEDKPMSVADIKSQYHSWVNDEPIDPSLEDTFLSLDDYFRQQAQPDKLGVDLKYLREKYAEPDKTTTPEQTAPPTEITHESSTGEKNQPATETTPVLSTPDQTAEPAQYQKEDLLEVIERLDLKLTYEITKENTDDLQKWLGESEDKRMLFVINKTSVFTYGKEMIKFDSDSRRIVLETSGGREIDLTDSRHLSLAPKEMSTEAYLEDFYRIDAIVNYNSGEIDKIVNGDPEAFENSGPFIIRQIFDGSDITAYTQELNSYIEGGLFAQASPQAQTMQAKIDQLKEFPKKLEALGVKPYSPEIGENGPALESDGVVDIIDIVENRDPSLNGKIVRVNQIGSYFRDSTGRDRTIEPAWVTVYANASEHAAAPDVDLDVPSFLRRGVS